MRPGLLLLVSILANAQPPDPASTAIGRARDRGRVNVGMLGLTSGRYRPATVGAGRNPSRWLGRATPAR